VFVFLTTFIKTDHKSVKDVHIDPEKKRKEQHGWNAVNN